MVVLNLSGLNVTILILTFDIDVLPDVLQRTHRLFIDGLPGGSECRVTMSFRWHPDIWEQIGGPKKFVLRSPSDSAENILCSPNFSRDIC